MATSRLLLHSTLGEDDLIAELEREERVFTLALEALL